MTYTLLIMMLNGPLWWERFPTRRACNQARTEVLAQLPRRSNITLLCVPDSDQ